VFNFSPIIQKNPTSKTTAPNAPANEPSEESVLEEEELHAPEQPLMVGVEV